MFSFRKLATKIVLLNMIISLLLFYFQKVHIFRQIIVHT